MVSSDENHTLLWQLHLLAQPDPAKDAIHWALLSLLISSTCLMATALLPAASFAPGVISPTLAKRHMACALTAVVDKSRLYWPTTVPRSRSVSCRPVARTICATLFINWFLLSITALPRQAVEKHTFGLD